MIQKKSLSTKKIICYERFLITKDILINFNLHRILLNPSQYFLTGEKLVNFHKNREKSLE